MNRWPMYPVVFCVFSLPIGLSDIAGTNRAVIHPAASRNNEQQIATLLSIIRDEGLRDKDPERVAEAIGKLGEMKATEAIAELLDLLTFRLYEPWEKDPALEPSDRLRTSRTRYPALGALVQMGEAGLPALTEVVENSDPSSLKGKCALEAIRMMYPNDVERAVEFLEEAVGTAATPEGKHRLRAAARRLKDIKGYKPPP